MRWAWFSLFGFALVLVLYRATVGLTWSVDPSISDSELDGCKALMFVSMDNPIERLPLTSIRLARSETGSILATLYFVIIPYARHELINQCSESRRIWK